MAPVLLALASVPAALAGDRAAFNPIGYSPDGRYFAFEQYGIQDGSGFAYSEIFVIDLETERFAGGAPIRQRASDETTALAQIRGQAMEAAAEGFSETGIAEPAHMVALHGDGELDGDRKTLAFGFPGFGIDEVFERFELSLETFPASSPADCSLWSDQPVMGFALRLAGAGETTELHRDETLPASRNCAADYSLYAVVQPRAAYDLDAAVAVVSVYAQGFEGPDRRFIGIPLGRTGHVQP